MIIERQVFPPAETMRFVHAGARGIVRKTAEISALMAFLEAVAKGRVEDCVLRYPKAPGLPEQCSIGVNQHIPETGRLIMGTSILSTHIRWSSA